MPDMTNSQSYFSLNGQQLTDSLPLDLLNDRGLAYGHGLFETILLHDSSLTVKRHLSRLEKDSTLLNIPIEYDNVANYVDLFVNQLKALIYYSGCSENNSYCGAGWTRLSIARNDSTLYYL